MFLKNGLENYSDYVTDSTNPAKRKTEFISKVV